MGFLGEGGDAAMASQADFPLASFESKLPPPLWESLRVDVSERDAEVVEDVDKVVLGDMAEEEEVVVVVVAAVAAVVAEVVTGEYDKELGLLMPQALGAGASTLERLR